MGINKENNLITDTSELRRHAEARLSTKPRKVQPPRTKESTQRLVHELQVHQIEQEMQIDELRHTRDAIDTALENYADLYDFAPVGYVTLDRKGAISSVNLSGASLLGVERTRLIGRDFARSMPVVTRPIFAEFLAKVFASHGKESCEVSLTAKGDAQLFVRVEAVTSSSGQECRVALIDITELKRYVELIQSYIEELHATNEELTRFNKASVGRELRMIELKKEINELYVQSGKSPRYPLDFEKG